MSKYSVLFWKVFRNLISRGNGESTLFRHFLTFFTCAFACGERTPRICFSITVSEILENLKL
jgi:hypothetical protein